MIYTVNNLFPRDIDAQQVYLNIIILSMLRIIINMMSFIYTKCMEQTWYLALDTQLFIVSPIIVYLIWRWPIGGFILLNGLFLAFVGVNFAIFAAYKLPPTIMFTRTKELLSVGGDIYKYYDKPWTRAPPYILGILRGWQLHSMRDSHNKPLPNV